MPSCPFPLRAAPIHGLSPGKLLNQLMHQGNVSPDVSILTVTLIPSWAFKKPPEAVVSTDVYRPTGTHNLFVDAA